MASLVFEYQTKLYGVTASADELNILDGVTSTAAELNIMDGVTTTAAELNLIDGGTARGTTAVVSGDGVLINDGGTMRMTNVDTVSTYFASHTVGGGNIVTTGALNAGSITSGFGTIDTGSSTITTTGLISGGSLDIDDVLINGTTIGHTDDTDLMTLADGILTVAGRVDAADDIKTDAIRRYSDSSTTTKIILNDEVLKFHAGDNSNETLKIENNAITVTGTLTVTSPVINTGVSGTAVLDEDNMTSDSATQLATQQSIKAYTDATSTAMAIALG